MEKIYNKLVRDKIPEIIENDGEKPIVRVLNDNEYKKELEKKLKEEYEEFLIAEKKSERLEELADMLEVIRTLALLEDEDIQFIIDIMDKKREKRGGFTKKLFLEKTTIKWNSPKS